MERIGRIERFKFLYFLQHFTSVILIVLLLKWIGFPPKGFGWHPVVMTVGMVLLYGNSILIYRGFRYERKTCLKLLHAIIHALAFIFTSYGLYIAFSSRGSNSPHLYSLHSWVGFSAVLLFAFQYVAGFLCYLFPVVGASFKVSYMPLHIYFGLLGFILAMISCLLGVCEKSYNGSDYKLLTAETILVNSIGSLIVIYGSLVLYLVTDPTYKRELLPEEIPVMRSNCGIL